jgi:hypothetical protein
MKRVTRKGKGMNSNDDDKMKYKNHNSQDPEGGTNKEIYQPAVGLVKNQEEPMVCLAELISLLVPPGAASSAEMTTPIPALS